MNAVDYLSRAYMLDQRVHSKMQQIESLKSLASSVSIAMGSEPVSKTRNVAAMENLVIRIMEAEQELKEQVENLVTMKLDIASVISQIRDPGCSLVLEKRYLIFKSWEAIARELGFSIRWVHYKHECAVRVVQKILDEREGEPEPIQV